MTQIPPSRLTRRACLGGLAAGLATLIPGRIGGDARASLPGPAAQERRLGFRAAERRLPILGGSGPGLPLWTYSDTPLDPVRINRGDRLIATLTNDLKEHTSIHWHGLRLPTGMDGVPYISQAPVLPGESFTYDFTAEDAGTFFFHPHCNETGQVGRGMAGILIVGGDERVKPDAEIVLAVKDWRLAEDGTFLPLSTEAGASKGGTFGTVRAVNGERAVAIDVPAQGQIRIRLLNLDSTRVMDVGFDGGRARPQVALIAVDGHRLEPLVFGVGGFETWKMGPAMRADLLIAAPKAGESLTIVDYQGAEPWVIATLRGVAAPVTRRRFNPDILAGGTHPLPRLSGAERIALPLGGGTGTAADYLAGFAPDDPLAKVLMDTLCVRDQAYWSIDGQSWPSGDHRNLPPPLRVLRAGRSYVLEIENRTAHAHPIHLHGHVFRVLSSARTKMPVHDADTVLVAPRDRVEIAFQATEGLWMFHCHVLDHLETGMMGYFKVVA